MPLLKPKEIRSMRPEDLRAKLKELQDELMHERGVAAMGGAPASPGRIRALRTSIARIHTIQRELELAGAARPAGKSPARKRETEVSRTIPRDKKEKAEKPKKEEKK